VERIDTTTAHPARRYNYWLGGKDNFAADRASGDAIAARFPNVRIGARANREFLNRAVRFLAGEAGIRQFLDVGSGIPTAPNVHQVAQEVAPASRVVYVDHDPLVFAHSGDLQAGDPRGRTAFVAADLRDVNTLLASPALTATIDLGRPVALLLVAIMHFIGDDDDPYGVVQRLVDALPPGSYLALSHLTGDFDAASWEHVAAIYRRSGVTMQVRSRAAIERFFDGLELVEPGVQVLPAWRPEADAGQPPPDVQVSVYGGLARKP
jgi:SAM-dependent methyltransferase